MVYLTVLLLTDFLSFPHRYLAEFEFRYNTRKITDGERAVLAVRGGDGKRLAYRQPH